MTKPGALFYMDLNNRRTGKHATKPRALGLLGHSVLVFNIIIASNAKDILTHIITNSRHRSG